MNVNASCQHDPLDYLYSSVDSECHLERIQTRGCLARIPVSGWIASRARRIIDISVASSVLCLFAIPMAVIAVWIRLTSEGDAIFSQVRVGMGGQPFRIYKFRSMTQRKEKNHGSGLTRGGDDRVTPVGRILRKFKLDELPQFYNILRGDMSIVGPRPKLPQYAGLVDMPFRPGITGLASIIFRREEEILHAIRPEHMEQFYATAIKPLKTHLDVCYMCKANLLSDLQVIGCTFFSCIIPNYVPYARVRTPNPKRGISPLISITASSQSPASDVTGS